MFKPLRVLIIEDIEDDALLLIRSLQKGGYDPEYLRVETAAAMSEALRAKQWDIILCDYHLPNFNALEAIALLKKTKLSIPLILISGNISEEMVLECLHQGARDYISKGNMLRLIPVIQREMAVSEEKNLHRQAMHDARERLKELQAFFNLAKINEKEDITLDKLYQELVDILPNSWQYPEVTCARIVKVDSEFRTKNFSKTHWMQSAPIKVKGAVAGRIEVGYLEERPQADEGPFLKEERMLINAIAERTGRITERKLTENELIIAESTYKNIFLNSQIGIFRTDLQTGIILEANDTVARVIGYPDRAALLADPFSIAERYVDRHDREKMISLLQASGEIKNFETRFRRNDGSIIWMRFSAKLVREKGWIEGVAEDITDRKRAEDQLRESEENLRKSQRIAHLGSWSLDLASNQVVWSDELYKMYGFNSTLPPPPYTEHKKLFTEKSWEILSAALSNTAATGIPYELELETLRKDGSHGWMWVRGETRLDASGATVGLWGAAQDITERKQAEEAIKLNESRLESLLRINQHSAENIQDLLDFALNEAIVLTGSKIGYIYFYDDNKKEFTLNTWSREVMQQCTVTEPQTVYQLEKTGIWGEAVRQGQPIVVNNYAAPHQLKKGIPQGHAPLHKFLTVPVFSEGHIVAVVGVANKRENYDDADIRQLNLMMDAVWKIVQRRRTGEKLQRLLERFDMATRAANLGVWELDIKNDRMIWDDRMYELYGLKKDDFAETYEAWINRLHPDDVAGVRDEISQTLRDEKKYNTEFRVICPDGAIKNLRAYGKVSKDASGRPLRVTGINYDATEQRLSAQALRESEQKYRSLFAEIIEGFALHEIICDDRGNPVDYRFLDVNPAFEKLTGLHAADVIGENVLRIMPQLESFWIETYGKVALTGEPVSFENYAKDLDRYYQVNAFCPQKGRFAVLITDITERKKMEVQLIQSHKMEAIGTLAGGIAHDFNNILGAIIGYAGMAQEELPAGSEAGDCIDEIFRASERAKDLVAQILAFSRHSDTDRKPLLVVPVIKEIVKLLRPMLPSTIHIKQEINIQDKYILADSTQLHQVLMNLCTNAAHAMQEKGGTLTIGLNQIAVTEDNCSLYDQLEPGAYLELRVADTGHGIDEKIRRQIFDPFFTTKKSGEGTGMGLSVVHGIVKSYGGNVSLESMTGTGTTFFIYLPLLSDQNIQHTPEVKAAPIGGKERILLVDDQEFLLHMMSKSLSRLGYQVTAEDSSLEALNLFQADPFSFDLVITDQTMPSITGADMAKYMLKIRPDIPVILCTGFSSTVSHAQARSLGIREYVMKPVVMSEFTVLIRKVLEQ